MQETMQKIRQRDIASNQQSILCAPTVGVAQNAVNNVDQEEDKRPTAEGLSQDKHDAFLEPKPIGDGANAEAQRVEPQIIDGR